MLNVARRTFKTRNPRFCFTKHLTEAFDVQLIWRYIYNENSSTCFVNHRWTVTFNLNNRHICSCVQRCTMNRFVSRMTLKNTIMTLIFTTFLYTPVHGKQNTILVSIWWINMEVHIMLSSELEIIYSMRQRLFVSQSSTTTTKYFWHIQNYYHLKHWLLSLTWHKTQICRNKRSQMNDWNHVLNSICWPTASW